MRGIRLLERLAWVCGLLLLTVWGATRAHGEWLKRRDLARFEETRRSRLLLADNLADQSLWSQGRIEAYRETLCQEAGPPLAVLRIPTLDLVVPVLEGTDDFALNRAVGRIEGTSRLGEGGNIGIAGHRDGFFRDLGNIGPGDRIMLETLTGIETFIVEATKIVQPGDVDVLAPTVRPTLTLVTCYPFYFVGPAPQRYIVRAVRAESKSGV